ncbi:hypothetical protein BB558_002756 [Smittium angustum]|uniref:serine C-palmitoyltransferase n=1 Tax=Smittium angustum TaxID=133377 RepID=A0A2U1J7U2_SMIAN|nr:hypothetical protein BB558_002756 [Smittium angustum]
MRFQDRLFFISKSSLATVLISALPVLGSSDAGNHSENAKTHGFFSYGARFVVRYVKASYRDDPFRTFLELCLVLFIVWYVSKQKYKFNQVDLKLSEKDIEELIKEWKPEPIVPLMTTHEKEVFDNFPVIDSPTGTVLKLDNGKSVINFVSHDFLGLMNNANAKEKAVNTLRKYGVGPCGPPGFYGTLDVHMELEALISSFLKADATILYSQAMSVCVSVIPCFSKRGDIIVADDQVNFMLQQGILLSRSRVYWYKHNDMEDLKKVLEKIDQVESKKKGPIPRKFIVAEGLSMSTGNILKLDKIMELKKQFKYRLILDESLAIGAIGPRGAGTTDLFGISVKDVEILIGSLCLAFGGSGGFCCSSKQLIGHQRLSGAGYVFSAAMPAIMAITAADGIRRLETDSYALLNLLRRNIATLRSQLGRIKDIVIEGDIRSPQMHIRLTESAYKKCISSNLNSSNEQTWENEDHVLLNIVSHMRDNGILVSQCVYVKEHEHNIPRPSIRVLVSCTHTQQQLEKLSQGLEEAIKAIAK